MKRADVHFVRADQCCYGLRGPEGGLHRKATGFVTKCSRMAKTLSQRFAGITGMRTIGGNKSRLAQKYPEKLIDAILQCHSEHVGVEVEIQDVNNLLDETYHRDYVINGHFKEMQHQCQDGRSRVCQEDGRGQEEQRGELHQILAGEPDQSEDLEPGEIEEPVEEVKEMPLADRFSLSRLVRRAHEGLGHPDRDRFIRILKYSKAKPEVLAEARCFTSTCGVCERHRKVRPSRRSAPPRELEFNDCVGVDVIDLPLPGGNHKARPTLNIIDWSSKFQLMVPLTAKNPHVVREAYIDSGSEVLDHRKG